MALQSNISTDMVVVEPGATAPLTIDVENIGETEDQVEVGIEGIDGEWLAIPVPIVKLKPGEKQSVKIFFKPPRLSESTAGNFPFVAKVRSLNDGDIRSAQGVLTIKPFHSVTLEVNPKKGFVTPTKRQNLFTVTLINMGNSEHMIQLTADDPEDVCAYEFDEEQITLGPGQQKDVDFLVNPKKGSPFGSSRLIGFAITGRSINSQGVVATSQGQLEIRPFLTPWTVSISAVVALILAILWYTQPKQPTIHLEIVGKQKVFEGSFVTVHWTAEHATSVKLVAGGQTYKDNLPPEGQEDIPAPLVGTLRIQAQAFRDKRSSETDTISVNVEKPIVIPDPEIKVLDPSKLTVNKGEKFTLKYKFGPSVTRAVLGPLNIELNLNLNSILIEPSIIGENEYTVVAYNSANKPVPKTFKVNMIDPCLAKIVRFEVEPLEVDPVDGKVTLSWQVATAAQIELTYTGASKFALEPVGSREVPIIGKTTFTIKAIDINGKSITRSITVDLKKPEIPPDTNTPPDTTGTGTAGGTTTGR